MPYDARFRRAIAEVPKGTRSWAFSCSSHAAFFAPIRRFRVLLVAAGLCCAFALFPSRSARAADSTDDVQTNNGTNLSLSSTYVAGIPSGTSDVTFTNSSYAATTFDTSGGTLNYGTLDDLDTTQALVITDSTTAASITLNSLANNTGSPSAAADLLYVANGANLTIQSGAGALTLNLAASGNFDIAGTASANIGAVIAGSGFGFTKTGGGTLTLSGLNTYTGLTTVSTGTLRLGTANAINTANSLTVGSTGTFDLGGNNQTLEFVTNGGTITNSNNSTQATLTIIDTGPINSTMNGAGAWSGNMNVVVTLSNENNNGATYTGSWTNTGNITLNDNDVSGTLASISLTTGTVNNKGAIINSGTGLGTDIISANIGGNVTGVTQSSFLSQLALGGADAYGGNTTVNAGALVLDFSQGTAPASDILSTSSTLVLGGGLLSLKGKGSGNSDVQAFNRTILNAGGSFIDLNLNSSTSVEAILGAITRNTGGTLNFTVVPNSTTTIATTANGNDGSGGSGGGGPMLGTWASAGNGTSMTYVVVNGSGQIVPYTYAAGDILSAGANVIAATNGAENYTLSGTAATSAVANASINTLQYTGGGITITPATGGLTVNGIMNAGTGTLTLSGGSTNPVTIGANKELVLFTNGRGFTISAPIVDNPGGASGVTMAGNLNGEGSGQFTAITLSGTNTFSGPLSVNNGALLAISSNANLGGSAATVTLNGAGNAGTAALGFGNSATGANGGGLEPATGGAILTGLRPIILGSGGGGGLIGNGTYDINFSGSGGFWVGVNNISANVLLTGNNAYTGLAGILNGKLMISSSANLGAATSPFVADAGTLDILGTAFTSFGQHTVTWNTVTLDIQSPANTFTLNQNDNNINGGLTKTGEGTLSITVPQTWGINSGSSTATMNGGTLEVNASAGASLQTTNKLGLAFGGGTFLFSGTGTTNQTLGNVTVNAGGGTVEVNSNGGTSTLILGTLVSSTTAGASLDLVATGGAATITTTTTTSGLTNNILSGRYVYNGADWATVTTSNTNNTISGLASGSYTNVNAGGTLSDSNNSIVNDTPSSALSGTTNSLKMTNDTTGQQVSLTGGTLVLTSGGLLFTGPNAETISGGTLESGTGSNASTPDLIIQDYGAGALTINSTIANNPSTSGISTLTKAGPGTLILSNSSANTYTGQTYINGGVLSISNNNQLGGTSFNTTVNINGGTLQFTGGGTVTSNRNIILGGSGGTIDLTNNSALTLGGVLSGGALTVTSSDYATNPNSVLILGNANTFSDGLFINSGTVRLANASALGANASGVSANGLNTLTFGSATTEELELNGNSAYLAGLTDTSGNAVVDDNGAAATLAVFNGGNNTFAGKITGLVSLVKGGGLTLTLSGTSSTYTGTTTLENGILNVANLANGGSPNTSSIGSSTNVASNLVFGGGTLQYTDVTGAFAATGVSTDRLFTIGAAANTIVNTATLDSSAAASTDTMNFTNTGSIAFGSTYTHTLTLTGSNTGSNTFAPKLTDNTGATSLVKTGAGTWVVSNAGNSFSGGTSVSNGTLRVTGSLGAGPVAVSNGSLIAAGSLGAGAVTIGDAVNAGSTPQLSGSGAASIAGPVTILGSSSPSVGTINGTSGATLSLTGGLTLNAGAISNFTLSGSSYAPALIATSGATNSLVTGGSIPIGLANPTAGTNYELFSYSGANPAFTISTATITAYPNLIFNLSTGSGAVDLSITALAGSVAWTGASSPASSAPGSWDTAGSTGNWVNTTGGSANTYADGDTVAFGSTFPPSNTPVGSQTAVTIQAAGINPATVNFTNNVGTNYTFTNASGSIGIGGANGATIVMSGTGQVTFMSPNSFTGAVVINAGQLNLENSSALGSSSGVSIASGASLTLQGGIAIGNIPIASLAGTGLNSNGALQSVMGANSYAGAITIGSGGATITSSNPGDTLTLTGGITNGGNLLSINGPGNTTISTAAINGAGGLAFTGGGTLTLSAANGYTGLTTISDPGILSIPSSGNLAGSLTYSSSAASTIAGTLSGAASVLTVNNGAGTLILNGANTYGGGTALSAGTIRLGASSVGGSSITSGALGAGTVAITGGTLQDNGTAIAIENSFTIGGTVTFSSTGSGSLTLDGTSLSPTKATVTLTSNATLIVDNTTTINDAISGGGFGINTSGGAGTLILGGANTFTGGTTINPSNASSVVLLTNPNALQDSVVTLNDPSGIAFNAGIGGVAFGGLNGSVNLTVQDSAAAPISLTLGNNAGNNAAFSGNLTGGTSLAKTGANTQTLSGNNTFSGGLTVSGGILALSGNNTFSTAPNAITISGGTLRVSPSQSGNSPLGTSPIALSGGTLQFQPASSIGVHFGTDQDGGAYVLPAGTSAGVFSMVNWNNAPGATGSTANITGPIAGSLATNAGTVAGGGATTVSWSSGSTFSFGGSTTGFSGDNLLMGSFTNTGATTVNFTNIPYSSYEVIAYVGNEGANERTANISIGGTTYYYSTDTTHTGSGAFSYIPITNTNSGSNPGGNYAVFTGLTGSSFTATLNQVGNSGLDGIEIIDQSIPISLPNTVNITNSSTIDLGGYANVAMNGAATIGSATLTVQGSDPVYSLSLGATGSVSLTGNPTFNVTASGTGNLTLGSLNDNGTARTITLIGGGALTLNSAATSLVQGTVVNVANGTLNSNATGALGSLASVNLGPTGAFSVGASQTVSALNSTAASAGAVTIAGSGTSLTVGNNVDNLSSNFSGVISGSGALVKSGSGTLTLSGGNAYQAGTTINAGAVAVGNNSALGSGPVTLAGGTLRLTPSVVPALGSAGSIAVQFVGAGTALAATDSAGLPAVAQTNWNAITGGPNLTTGQLSDNSANLTTATLTAANVGGLYVGGGGISTPAGNLKLTSGEWYFGGSPNPSVSNQSITLNNIPYADYSVYVYGDIDAGGRGTVLGLNTGATFNASAATFESFTTEQGPNWVLASSNWNGTGTEPSVPSANYALFSGVSGSSFTIGLGSVVSNAALNGIEIVNTTPLPTASIANSIAVTQDSSIALNGTTGDSVGPLSIGGNMLSISGTSTGTNAPYTLTTGAVTLSGNATFNVANNGSGAGALILGALNDNSPASGYTITLTGGGALTLNSPATSLVAGTVVNVTNGTLNANAAGALGATATVNVASLGSLSLAANQTLSALNGAGTVNLNANALTVGSSDNLSSSFGGTINGSGTLTLAGTGTFALTSTASITGNAAINVNPGATLAVQPSSGGTITAAATLSLSGTFDMTGASTVGTLVLPQTSGGAALTINSASLLFSLSSTAASELSVTGPSTAVASVSGTNTVTLVPVSGTTMLSLGSYPLIQLPAGSSGLLGTFDFSNDTTSEILSVGSASYRLTLVNSATAETLIIGSSVNAVWQQTAAGPYSWSSESNWSNGIVPHTAGDAAVFGVATSSGPQTITVDQPSITVGSLTFNNTGSSVYTIAPDSNSDPLTLDNGGPSATASLVNATNNNIISAPLNFTSIIAADVATGTSLTLSGALTGSAPLNVNPDAGNTGTLIISASNSSLTSPINIKAGTLNFASGSLGSGNITFTGSGTLQYAAGNSQDVSGRIEPIGSGIVATIDTNGNANVTFSSGLSGPGGLNKAGAGMLILSAANSYQGPTTVSGGSLQIAGAGSLSATSGVMVGANGTLGGSGTINSSVSTVAGGTISPSLGLGSAATLTINNNLTLANGSVLGYFLGGNLGNDLVSVGGSFSLGTGGTLNVTGSPSPGTYELVSFSAGEASGSVSGWSVPGNSNDTFSLSNISGQFDLIVSAGSATWSDNGNTAGLYSTGGNWSTGQAPNGAGLTATFGSGSQAMVSVNGSFIVGQLNFNNGGNSGAPASYLLAGNGNLTLNNSGGGASVNVSSGSLAPSLGANVTLTLADSSLTTTFNIASGSSLTLGGAIGQSSSGQRVVLSGGGTLELESPNSYTGSTTINSGIFQVDSGASIASTSVSIGAGGTLQLVGTTGALPSTTNISTHGTGSAGDGALVLLGAATETVGTISGDTRQITDGSQQVTVYSGNTTVGDGNNSASLTATQILGNTLTINSNSTVTIAPSGSGIPTDAQESEAVSGVALAAGSSTADSDSSTDPFSAIQAAIASGSISSTKGQQLENRIAAIERLAATDPGLDVSLLEDRVLAALPSTSVWSSSGTSPLLDSGSGLLAVDTSTSGSSSDSSLGGATAFAPAGAFGGAPAAVPEPSTLLLAAMAGIGILIAIRRRTICRE